MPAHCATQAEEFRAFFKADLKNYMSSVTGFDILKFETDLCPLPDRRHQSIESRVVWKHGKRAVDLIRELIHLRDPLDAWREKKP